MFIPEVQALYRQKHLFQHSYRNICIKILEGLSGFSNHFRNSVEGREGKARFYCFNEMEKFRGLNSIINRSWISRLSSNFTLMMLKFNSLLFRLSWSNARTDSLLRFKNIISSKSTICVGEVA